MIKHETLAFFGAIRSDKVTVNAALYLLFLIFFLILIYTIGSTADEGTLSSKLAREIGLSRDGSLAEQIGQGVAFFASTIFLLTYIEYRSLNLFSLFALTAFIWFDDAATYHERFGRFLSQKFDLPAVAGLRPQDMGEFVAWALAASVLLIIFTFSYTKRKPGDLGILTAVFAAFTMLVFCGVILDFLHILAPSSMNLLIGILEDGGEMFAVAFIAIFSLGLMRNYDAYIKNCTRK